MRLLLLIPALSGATWLRSPEDTACKDESKACGKMRKDLFILGSNECRYPMAELCPRSCGRCRSVNNAMQCKSALDACKPFCDGAEVNWVQFLQRVVSKSGHPGAKIVRKQPAVAEFPNYLSVKEVDTLVGIINQTALEVDPDLSIEVRHVEKADCESDKCRLHPFVNELHRRVSELLGIPYENFETIEFLRYGPGQKYLPHLDATVETSPGVGMRVLTVFFYLSDVEAGGETQFPNAKPPLTVKPQSGKMIVWANVKKKIHKPLEAALHAALPVQAGTKICANFWVHSTIFRPTEAYSPSGGC